MTDNYKHLRIGHGDAVPTESLARDLDARNA
jgi:hypothetical protein